MQGLGASIRPDLRAGAGAIIDEVDRAGALDIFPAAATRVVRLAGTPSATLDDLERAVSSDASLSGQLLRIANSGFFALSRTVGTVRDALLLLGFDHTRDLAVALSMSVLGRSERPRERSLWIHSLRVGVASQRLGRIAEHPAPGELFVAGLLHDLGKLALLAYDDDRYSALLEVDGELLVERERAAFGTDHAEIGAQLCERWALPTVLVETVRHHHHAALTTAPPGELAPMDATVLALADRAAYHAMVARDSSPDEIALHVAQDPVLSACVELLGLSWPHVDELVATLDQQVAALQLG